MDRYRLFATDIVGTGANATLRYVGRYGALRSDLVRWDNQNLHGKGARYYGLEASAAAGLPSEAFGLNGFKVESLAITPDGGTAYLGFRAPLVPVAARSRALIIPVLNLHFSRKQ